MYKQNIQAQFVECFRIFILMNGTPSAPTHLNMYIMLPLQESLLIELYERPFARINWTSLSDHHKQHDIEITEIFTHVVVNVGLTYM